MATQTTDPATTGKPDQAASTVRQEFGAMERTTKTETASEVLAAQAVAEAQARFVMALKNPRDWDEVRQKLLKDCERPAFAKVARYSKPIGQKAITGLSIDFARAAVRHMRNISNVTFVIFDDPVKRIVRNQITDLESNTTVSKDVHLEKTVERKTIRPGQVVISSRINSSGDRTFLIEATEDDLLTKQSAWSAKFERQNILAVLPGDIQAECEAAIIATNKNAAAKDPEGQKREIIDAFDDIGVRVADLKAYLGVEDLTTLQPRDVVALRAVYQAVREGEATWRDVMEMRNAVRGEEKPAGSRTAQAVEALRQKEAAAQTTADPQKVAETKPQAQPEAKEATTESKAEAQRKAGLRNGPAPASTQPTGTELFPDTPTPKKKDEGGAPE